MPNSTDAFSVFLSDAVGQRDVSLVIAKNPEEMKRFQTDLTRERIPFRVLSEDSDKEAYDFACQFPTGQVEVFDIVSMTSKISTPDYSQLFIFLAIDEDLARIKAQGFDLLSKVGLTYRS